MNRRDDLYPCGMSKIGCTIGLPPEQPKPAEPEFSVGELCLYATASVAAVCLIVAFAAFAAYLAGRVQW